MIHWHNLHEGDPDQPLPVENGLQLHGVRGRGGQSWWAQRWVTPVERDIPRPILDNGRRYARKGQIIRFAVRPGQLEADIQGMNETPHHTVIAMPAFTDAQWREVCTQILDRTHEVASLLAGNLPHELEQLCQGLGLNLFPTAMTDLGFTCDCDEPPPYCTHSAALLHLFIDRIDDNPFLILKLCGHGQDELLTKLRQAWGVPAEDEPQESDIEVTVHDLPIERFYHTAGDLDATMLPPPPQQPARVIRRLGFPPFFPHGERTILQTLANMYETPDEVMD